MADVSTQTAPAHPRSEGTVNPALRLFQVPPTDISINAYRMVTVQPTTTGINPMEFIIPGLDDFVDLGRSYFTMELRLQKSTNDNLDAAQKLWPVNNTDKAGDHAAWAALPANHKAAYEAMVAEVAKYAGGVTHSLVFTPHLEVFHTGKLLVPGIEIKMKFHFNGPSLFLNGVALAGRLMEGDVKLRFHLCQLRLNDAIYQSLSAKRHNQGQVAAYPTVRSEIRTFSMQGNLTRFDIPNLFQNRIPDRLIVGLLDSRAFNGDVTRDPFCFQKFGLSSIRQIVKGEEYPYKTLHLVHNNGTRDNLGYFRFLQASGAWCKKKGNMVELGDWGQAKKCTLYMFDNVANGCADSQTLNPKQTGDLQLVLQFGAAPGTNITVLVYGEFENLLEIDSNGAVLYNIYQH